MWEWPTNSSNPLAEFESHQSNSNPQLSDSEGTHDLKSPAALLQSALVNLANERPSLRGNIASLTIEALRMNAQANIEIEELTQIVHTATRLTETTDSPPRYSVEKHRARMQEERQDAAHRLAEMRAQHQHLTPDERIDDVKELRAQGMTYQKIADIHGVSYNQVVTIVHYTPKPAAPIIRRPTHLTE